MKFLIIFFLKFDYVIWAGISNKFLENNLHWKVFVKYKKLSGHHFRNIYLIYLIVDCVHLNQSHPIGNIELIIATNNSRPQRQRLQKKAAKFYSKNDA